MMDRRDALKLLGASSLVGLSGCSGLAQQFDQNEPSPSPNETPGEGAQNPGGTETAGQGGTAGGTESDSDSDSGTDSGSGSDGDSSAQYPAKEPSGALLDVEIPSNPDQYEYPTMGPDDAPVTVQFFGSYKCPYTREFALTFLNDLVESYVRSGDIQIRYRNVTFRNGEPFLGPDAPKAARAGLAVWENDPEHYWPYFATLFQSQPPERNAWGTTAQLQKFANAAGVTREARRAIATAIENNRYTSRIQASVDAAEQNGVNTVPRVVVDGETLSPNLEPESVVEAIEQAVQNA